MVLSFLPASDIPSAFTRLQLRATTNPLMELVNYIASTCIFSTTFPPKDWTVYVQTILTNNNIEGWHNGLNPRTGGRVHIPFYLQANSFTGKPNSLLTRPDYSPMVNWREFSEKLIAAFTPRSLMPGKITQQMQKKLSSHLISPKWSGSSTLDKDSRLRTWGHLFNKMVVFNT